MAKSLIVLIGATGVGKTELSLRLAERLKCPILSSDSRQLYRDLEIGTATPTPEQLSRVRHYFVKTLGLEEYYSAARFEEEVLSLLDRLFLSLDTVVMTGGSMMYIDAVCKGIDLLPTVSSDVRQTMKRRLETEGLEALCRELEQLDPDHYGEVDLKNPKRVVHALEICHMTGRSYSSLRTNRVKERPFRIVKVGLARDRAELYDRINSRVDQMIAGGLVDEACRVYPFRHFNSLNTVGYKELFRFFDGELTLPEAIEKIKQSTRIYSRKQMTWFKRDPDIVWFHPDCTDEIITYIDNRL